MKRSYLLLLLGVWIGCRRNANADSSAPADWIAWQAKRKESVAGTNGWTTLVGLHWLREGRSSAGSDPTNSVVFPRDRSPGRVGAFVRVGGKVRFEVAPGVPATVGGNPVQSVDLVTDALLEPTKLQIGPLLVIVIERGERIGLRVRDQDSPTRAHFKGIEYFPYDPAWRITGRFEPARKFKKLRVQDVTGGTQEYVAPGVILFTHAGVEYRLEGVDEPGERDYFVIFHDETAGHLTYPSGRFLYVAKPDAAGRVVIDFNRSYNPPCAFTEYATCPLPPRQNWLPFPIQAGERIPSGHH